MFAAIVEGCVSLLGKTGGKLVEFSIAAALLIVLVGGPYWLGMRHQKETDAALQAQMQTAAAHKLLAAQTRGDAIAAQLAQAQANVRVVYQTITQEVPHVVFKYRPRPGAALRPVPRAVFTVGAIRLWNHALDPELSAGAGVPAQDATGADAALDSALDSGVTEQQLLANHVVNAESCDAIRRQLAALIAWHQSVDRP